MLPYDFQPVVDMPDSDAHILLQLARAVELFRVAMAEQWDHLGLSASRAAVLRIVAESYRVGCTQTKLAQAVGLSESNVSGLIERMRADGLLSQMRSKQDRRCCVLLLTEHGAAQARAAAEYETRFLEIVWQRLTEQLGNCNEIRALATSLEIAVRSSEIDAVNFQREAA